MTNVPGQNSYGLPDGDTAPDGDGGGSSARWLGVTEGSMACSVGVCEGSCVGSCGVSLISPDGRASSLGDTDGLVDGVVEG